MVLTIASGEITDAELSRHQQCLGEDVSFDSEYVQLWDSREAKAATGKSSPDMQFVSAPHVKRAVVVSSKLSFGLGRQLEMTRYQAHEGGLRIFNELTDGLEWIERSQADYDSLLQGDGWVDV